MQAISGVSVNLLYLTYAFRPFVTWAFVLASCWYAARIVALFVQVRRGRGVRR